jgi:putative ABC transport system permease protein
MRILPNRLLAHQIRRDLRRRPAQAIAVAITVMLGVAVSGIAGYPEYLWPARSRQDVLDDPHSANSTASWPCSGYSSA